MKLFRRVSRPDAATTPPERAEEQQEPVGQVTLVANDVADLRSQVLLRSNDETNSVVIEVTNWEAPFPGWRGRPRVLPGLLRQSIEFGDEPAVRIEVTVSEPTPVANVIESVIPLLIPAAGLSAWVSCLVSFDDQTPVSALASLPLDARPLVEEPDPNLLRSADLLVTKEGTEPDDRANSLGVVADGAVIPESAIAEVIDAPLPVIDPRVHRPVGRLRAQAKGVDATLVQTGRDWEVRRSNGDVLARLGKSPLSPGDVAGLTRVARLNLSALGTAATPDSEGGVSAPALGTRIAELAAVGVELHSAPPKSPALHGWPQELSALLGAPRSTTNGIERTDRSLRQRRLAMQNFAGPIRLAAAGRPGMTWPNLPAVTVLLVSRRPGELVKVLQQLEIQTYPELDVVIGLHGVAISDQQRAELRSFARVSAIYEAPADEVFGHVLGKVSAMAQGDLLTKVDDDDVYGPDHIWDLVLARLYSGAHIVGKRAQYAYLSERDTTVHRKIPAERYAKVVAGGTILIGVADLAAVGGWRPVPRSVDRGLIERVRGEGGIVYATEGIGYVYVRHTQGHTWQVELDQLAADAIETWQGIPAEVEGTARPIDAGR